MISIESIVEFEKSIRVSYLTLNTIPFEHLQNVTIEKTGRRIGDDPNDDEDDVLYVGGAEFLKVSVDTKAVVITTTDLSEIYRKPRFATRVQRVEDMSGIKILKINPEWNIQEIMPEVMKTKRSAQTNHKATITKIMSTYTDHQPKIVYEGPSRLYV